MVALGVVLAVSNAYGLRRDINLATGPESPNQLAFFVEMADRPDAATFYKNLKSTQRVAMAQNIGRYKDSRLAKLCGILLGDFDVAARAKLTQSLTQIANVDPEKVAQELARKGSFQFLAISAALRPTGERALPAVVKMLANGDARPNSVSFLVDSGLTAVPYVLPALNDASKDIRLAAADTLGKLRSPEAIKPLLALWDRSPLDERPGYLAALASIGDPSTESFLAGLLNDETLPPAQRAQAALGLGRVATPSATKLLWQYAGNVDPLVRNASISGLQAVGPLALAESDVEPAIRLEAAAGIQGPVADLVIRTALRDPKLGTKAARAAEGRPALIPELVAILLASNADTDGAYLDAAIESLIQTPGGSQALQPLKSRPDLAGLILRREQLSR